MTHVHHWRIDIPNGPTSDGVCKGCGETRAFWNYEPHESLKKNISLKGSMSRKRFNPPSGLRD